MFLRLSVFQILNSMNDLETDLKIDWVDFIRYHNEMIDRYKSICPKLRYLTKGKKAQVQRIVNEQGTRQVIYDAARNMAQSDVCNGRIKTPKYPKGLRGSFAWLTTSDEILIDVANGRYDNTIETELTEEERRKREAEKRAAEREEQRRRWRDEEEAERERRAKQREEWARGAVTYEEYLRMKDNLN